MHSVQIHSSQTEILCDTSAFHTTAMEIPITVLLYDCHHNPNSEAGFVK